MARAIRTAGMVVAAVALVATGVGALAGAGLLGAGAMGAAGTVAGISTATITAIGTYAGLAAGVLGMVAAAAAPGFSAQGSASNFTTNPQSGLPYAMGRTRMSGLRFFADTNTRPGYTKFNDLLWFGALLSVGGAIEGIESFKADNEVVTFDAGGNAIGTYRDYQAQKIHLGGPQAAALNTTLGGGTAPGWTSEHRLSGITHAMWALRFNKQGDMYGAGAPEPAWIGKWVKVYDPRLDSTYPGGSGACRPLQETTYVWSENPALHALTWALGRWQNGKRTCGIGAPISTIRVNEFVECANVCDANGWKVGGVEWTTDSKWDTFKRILQAGGAKPTQTGAMIGCMVSMPRVAIATIESRHLLDRLSLSMTKSRRDRFNTVIPRYVDEASDWAVISGSAITVADYVTADKGQRTKELDFPLVQVFSGETAKQPGQLAAYAIVDSREAGPWTFSTGPEWVGLKTGDVINLNVPEEGVVNQPVLITRRAMDPASGKVSFTVETETPGKHAFALGQTTTPPAPFQLSAPDLKPAAPLEISWSISGTTSGEGFPALLISGDSELPSADAVIIDYRPAGAAEWTGSAILSANEPVSHVVAPLESETAYDVRIGYRVEAITGDFTIFTNVVTGAGKIAVIEGQLGELDAGFAQLDVDVAAAETALAAAQVNISQIQTDAAATRAALEGEIGELGQQAAQTILDVQANAAALAAQASTLSAHDSALGQNQQALQSQAGTLAAQAATLLAHGADIGQAQADIIAAGGRMTTVEQTLGQQGATISSVSQTVDNAVGRLSSVETTLSAQGATVSLHASAISTAQQDIAGLRIDVAANGAAISQTASTVSGLGVSVANLAQTVTAGGGNLLDNTEFAAGETLPWAFESWNPGSSTMTPYVNASGAEWHPEGVNVISMRQVGRSELAPAFCRWRQAVQVQPGKWYEGSTRFAAHRAQVVLILAFYDRTGAYLTEVSASGVHEGGGTFLSDFAPLYAKWQAPANAAMAVLYLQKLNTFEGQYDSYAWFAQPQVAETLEGTAGPVPYSPGRNKAVVDIQAQAITDANTSLASLSQTVSAQGVSVGQLLTAMSGAQGELASLSQSVLANGASISGLQSAVSGLDGQMASAVTSLSAEPNAINRNGRFADWPQSLSLPNKWVTWAGSSYRAAGLSSQWAVEMDCLEGFQCGVMSRSIDDASLGTIVPGSWLVLEADVEFLAGSGAGSGLLLQFTGAQGEFRGEVSIPLVLPALSRRYKFEKIVQAPDYAGAPAALNGHIYAMGSWTGFGELVYKRLRWHRASVRYATPDEIELNRPLGLKAQVTQTATALSSVEGTLAQLGNTVSAQGASVSQLSSAMATAQGDIGTLSQTVSAHGASISTLDQSVSTLGQNASNLAKRTTIIEASAVGEVGAALNGNFETDLSGWNTSSMTWVPGDYGVGGTAHTAPNAEGIIEYGDYIAVYPENRSYKLSVRFASRGYGLAHYAGLRCFGPDKAFLGNVYMPSVAGQQKTFDWHQHEQVFSGSFSPGSMPFFDVGTRFPSGCRFVQPIYIGNYQGTGNGYADLDYVRFTDATDFVANDARITQTALALSTATTDLASLSQTVSAQGAAVSQLSQAMATAQAQLGTLESTVATQGVSVSQLSSAMSTAQADIGTLKTQVTAGGGNLLENTEFSGDFTPWYFDYYQIPANEVVFGKNIAGPDFTVPQADALCIRQIGQRGGNYTRWAQNAVPIEGGKWHEASCYAASHRASVHLIVVWTNAAGDYLGEMTAAAPSQGGGQTLSAFPRLVCKAPAPANATRAIFIMQKEPTLPGYADSFAWFIRPQLRETTQGAASPLPYSPASMRAVVNQQFGAVSTLQSTSASMATTLSAHDAAIGVNASAISSAAGRVATLESTVGTQGVSVSQLSQAMSNAETRLGSLESTVSAQGVSVSQHALAISTLNGVLGKWGVEIDVNGYVSGVVTNNNGQRADLTFRMDKTRWITPSGLGGYLNMEFDSAGRPTFKVGDNAGATVEIGYLA